MVAVAKEGWTKGTEQMDAAECLEVAEFLIEESRQRNLRLDMRHLVDKAFPDFLQHRCGCAETHWKDLVRSTLEEQLVDLQHTTTTGGRNQKKQHEQMVTRMLVAQYSERRCNSTNGGPSPENQTVLFIGVLVKSDSPDTLTD